MDRFKLLQLTTVCSHPKVIVGADGRKVLVPCGRCTSCLSQKANQNRRVLECEMRSHKYCLFVTLTYDEVNIPLMEAVKTDYPHVFDFYSVATGEYIMQYKFDKYSDLIAIKSKSNHGGYIPYIETTDLQKYIKRVRKHLSKYTNEKIRYYAISELGQLHFRPHFHILFMFDERTTFYNIRKVVNSCWTFGHVDTQLPKDRRRSAKYLSQYLNSYLSIPSLFKERKIRPRTFHSTALGLTFDKILADAIREQDYGRIVRYGARRIGEQWPNDVVTAWRSLQNYLFPKCKGYSLLSDVMRLRVYNLYPYLRTKYDPKGVATCRDLTNLVFTLYNNNKLTEYEQNRIFGGKTYEEVNPPTEENFLAALYCSRHFSRLCCWLNVSEQRLLSIINGYYQYRAQYSLKQWYSLLEELSCDTNNDIYINGGAYSNVYTDDIVNINGIAFDCNELRNLLENDDIHTFSRQVTINMQLSALKHREQNEYYISNLN